MRFVYANFSKDSGISYAIVSHLGKEFTGTAKLHPEDMMFASIYTGCNYAEMRAIIKALKYEKTMLKEKAKSWKYFLDTCMSCKEFDAESASAKVMTGQYYKVIKQIKNIDDEIEDIKKQLSTLIKDQTKYIEKRKIQIAARLKDVNE